MGDHQPYVTIRSRRPYDGNSVSSGADSTVGARVTTHQSRRVHSQAGDGQYGSSSGDAPRTATHDTSRVSYHVKHLDSFVQTLEDSANRAFPNRGRSSQRYKKVQALLLHWGSDDLFVLPELEDLERCLREDYAFNTDIFAIPSENSHLELMMQVGKLIKDHEAQDTLFLVYYGGHARIDESRQSTWCATRNPDSPWLQWSAIQTLLERSASDVLILLDCCAGAASATFPNGNSITETISASSWDAIAPDPGRYSFTNALIEVLQEWRLRTFSAAMLHAEVLARLKHPRPITINGKLFEARSTPVHFMMTTNHKAPSIEMSRIVPPDARPPSPPQDTTANGSDNPDQLTGGRGPGAPVSEDPNEDTPHVMISLALEDNQQLDLNAWEQWLSNFPAMAKTVFQDIPEPPKFSQHIETLLQQYYDQEPLPNDDQKNFVASNLGVELWHVEVGTLRILLVDLRSPTEFERSHIRGAINLRAPLRFIQDAPFDMIERAFADHDSGRKFGEWRSAHCLVVYARAVDSVWECPVADVLFAKFKSWGWPGRCFVLKGHYKEFSVSYSNSIESSKMTNEARAARTELALRRDAHKQTTDTLSEDDDAARRLQYNDLLTQIDSEEGRVNPSSSASNPTASSDRARAMEEHERDLEAEFRRRVPDLYRKALDVVHGSSGVPTAVASSAPVTPAAAPTAAPVQPDDGSGSPATRSDRAGGDKDCGTTFGFDTKAPLVEYLDRGLSHIRQGIPAQASSTGEMRN
ncbi:hypothetical protein K4K49_013156 [Colletotrichum sp. SAR 10_70]|nr:hypothetical protein K4K50_007169 [Colletotrichum sp. SAR 10_71]KAI8186450.1 hypothetical protein K4K49_013156 [Colletotrichum sp. SAR 10_70]KAI8188548.1 hypothetical protein KHU50_000883 [Colletotrichum sp. SAR 10_65]KAI8211766.1 hypothetical protein K4K52_009741 [Colletotrichum sp. SAR 10_76]